MSADVLRHRISGWGFRTALLVYSCAVEVVVWTALVPVTLARRLLGRAAPRELGHRLGRLTLGQGPRVLIHAVSVGEVHAAAALVARLETAGIRVLLTTTSGGGRSAGQRLAQAHANVDGCFFVPWDRLSIGRWIRANDIRAVVVVETEIWPNLFVRAADAGVPVFMVSARIPVRDVPWYRLGRPFFSGVLEAVTWIGAQSAGESRALLRAGAPAGRLEVAGDLKFDAAPRTRPLPPAVWETPDVRPLLVAGSTHRGEESRILEAAARLKAQGVPIRLVIAPRHVSRARAIREKAAAGGLNGQLLSEATLQPIPGWDALIADEYGWLPTFYEKAALALVGGTLVRFGGHSPIEAAAGGCPLLTGPYVKRFAGLARRLEGAGALARLPRPSAEALAELCGGLLRDPRRLEAMGAAARRVSIESQGAADRCTAVIAAYAAIR